MTVERLLRRGLVAKGDANAIRRGPHAIALRICRRLYGKATGRLRARLFG